MADVIYIWSPPPAAHGALNGAYSTLILPDGTTKNYESDGTIRIPSQFSDTMLKAGFTFVSRV